ncbi:MAG: hypothetical protein HQK49_06785 [Oligoflexia bacterium]|nr:hypothetical protein [Oligoflexia bacterium]
MMKKFILKQALISCAILFAISSASQISFANTEIVSKTLTEGTYNYDSFTLEKDQTLILRGQVVLNIQSNFYNFGKIIISKDGQLTINSNSDHMIVALGTINCSDSSNTCQTILESKKTIELMGDAYIGGSLSIISATDLISEPITLVVGAGLGGEITGGGASVSISPSN